MSAAHQNCLQCKDLQENLNEITKSMLAKIALLEAQVEELSKRVSSDASPEDSKVLEATTTVFAASPSGSSEKQARCTNCQTEKTSAWRRDHLRNLLCNSCGLYAKNHGIPRPIHMRNDNIRPRVRRSKVKKMEADSEQPGSDFLTTLLGGFPLIDPLMASSSNAENVPEVEETKPMVAASFLENFFKIPGTLD
ncbi:unnamed protein product [Caenorhabditis sp. 36 PRJEB53466]|nr:unnamed protein product [Caenorhabditis sp. 36 PRJEB53466]